MRCALAAAGVEAPAVLPDARGAPCLPAGVAGSITHKKDLAAALVAARSHGFIGVDLEEDLPGSIDISSKVLTDGELAELAGLDAAARGREVLLRFSAKEALYKALDPFVQRFVGFKEVSVSPLASGGARVVLELRPEEGPFFAEVRWRRFDGIVLTTAHVRAGIARDGAG
jgi:4'-phosphopantetheinyl transferase EntD